MAWEAGIFILTEGSSVRINFNWQGRYNGTQYALARPVMDLNHPLILPVLTGEREVRTMDHALMGRRHSMGDNVDWIYSVTVQNMNSDFAVFFDLTGGGVEP
jgi:hypothetical protein